MDSAKVGREVSEVEHLVPERRSSAALAARFRRFASQECSNEFEEGVGNRTYEILSETVACNPALLDLARRCRVRQLVPNLLLAAFKRTVAFPGSELARHYRLAQTGHRPGPHVKGAFTAFALAHRDQVIGYLETRLVQTNEVGRYAYLMPGF